MEADGQSGVGVHRLHDLRALVVDDPVGVNLRVAVRVQHHRLVGAKVGGVDLGVVGAVVDEVERLVPVHVVLAGVSAAVAVLVGLVRVVDEPAVVALVQDAVVVGVRVALVPHGVPVGVQLVGVRLGGAVVQVVGDPVAVNVVVAVAHVAKGVLVRVALVGIPDVRAVVASVTQAVSISVLLISIRDLGAVVPLVQDAVIVNVLVADVSLAVAVGVLLIHVGQERAVVAGVSALVVPFGLRVELVRVGHQRAVVRRVLDAVVVGVVVAGVPDAVHIGVLLPGVGSGHAVVPPAPLLLAAQVTVWPPVHVLVRAADLPVAGEPGLALADVVGQSQRPDAVGVLVAHSPVRAESGLVLAPHLLVSDVPADAGAAVEGAVRVHALGVLHAVAVVDGALVDVVAGLPLPGGEVESDPAEAVAAGVAGRAGAAPEARHGVVAGDGDVARVGQVALVQVAAEGPVAAHPLGAGAAAVVRRPVDVKALHALQVGRGKY